tara:strand:- start:944 stop:2146 length:1203 start_codon:yes stop_codon:yes gene_type:complete
MIFIIRIICYLLIFLSTLNAKSLNHSLNDFGFDLFRELNNQRNENLLISPLSIGYALIMVNRGASGPTSDNILSTLNIDSNYLDEHYGSVRDYIQFLNRNNFHISNSIWIQTDDCYLPNQSYLSFVDTVFHADAFYVNFAKNNLKIIKDINDWVSNATNGMIEDMVSDNDIKKTTVQALLNTLYFKGQWLAPFDSKTTKLDFFNTSDGEEQVYMMNKKNRYPYYSNEEFQLLELQYANSNVSMFLFLPQDNNELDAMINNFNFSQLEHNLDSLKITPGNISIPKFKSEKSYSMKENLKSMGMIIPFSPDLASFDGFWNYDKDCFEIPPKHYIDIINHKTEIDLDENGVEVAAATAIIINRITSIPSFVEPFTFIANKPFLYIIYDKEYDNIIFIGKYVGP